MCSPISTDPGRPWALRDRPDARKKPPEAEDLDDLTETDSAGLPRDLADEPQAAGS